MRHKDFGDKQRRVVSYIRLCFDRNRRRSARNSHCRS